MNPKNQPTQANTTQPLQYPFWYIQGKTVFGAKQGVAHLFPGWLIVTDFFTGQEVYRYSLHPDMKLIQQFGYVRIMFLNGQKKSLMDRQYMFYFYNPSFALLSYLFIFKGAKMAKSFAANCRQAAGLAR